jgi:hypothetical protein
MSNHLGTALLASLIPICSAMGQPTVRVVTDSARQEIVLSVGPIDIAPTTPYSHHGAESYHVIEWPVSGWLRGYRVDLVDSAGRLLPRELLHHAGMANLDRRQVAYPIAERVFAAAHETAPVVLPKSMGLPLSTGQRMVLYYGLVNPDTSAVTGAVLQVRIPWADAGTRGITGILPFYANARALSEETISFDIPAGRSETASEFTVSTNGWLRVVGGHLHDHGVELRIEDAESNKVLARVRGKRAAGGRLVDVSRARFPLKRQGLRLRANHRYRVVAVYDNATGNVIKGGAMGFVAGAFIPENVAVLERVDVNDGAYARDARMLLGGARVSGAAGAHSHH